MPTLHVVMPVFNEPGTLEPCVRRVLAARLPQPWTAHLILVDDFSDQAHRQAIDQLANSLSAQGTPIALHRHSVNQGKGAAVQTGFDAILTSGAADTDLVIIQDGDLEYDPSDFARLMQPLLENRMDAVIGTRWGAHRKLHRLKHRVHAMGNRALTLLSNLMTGYRVSDMECCYKMFSIGWLRRVRPMLTEKRFGIEPQLVAALAKLRARVAEVPISYDPRGPNAGKKIGWRDGVRALIVIARERLKPMRDETTDGRG